MEIKTFTFSRGEISSIDKELNEFFHNKEIIHIAMAVSSGNVLGGGGVIYTIVYK